MYHPGLSTLYVLLVLSILFSFVILTDAQREESDWISDKTSSLKQFPFMRNVERFLVKSGFPRAACECNTSETAAFSTDAGGKLVGFYNVFKREEDFFERIIKEQVQFLEDSGLSAASQTINVVYFGPKLHSFSVPTNSSNFVISTKSSSHGDERVTLQLLFDHCTKNRYDRVFYIHSKGTYHPSDENDLLRRNLMKAVVACWRLNGVAGSDVCGLRASPLPHPHYSGNMWLARCDYISKLHAPLTFEQAMDLATQERRPRCHPAFVGSSRFSQEHWVLSHPSVIVSDVLPMSRQVPVFAWGYENLPNPESWTPDLETFPRAVMPFSPFLGKNKMFAYLLGCAYESQRIREYHTLYGASVMAGLPCASMYCQWFPFAFAQLHTYNIAGCDRQIGQFLEDMLAVSTVDGGPPPLAAAGSS